jgi:hypothetical protein
LKKLRTHLLPFFLLPVAYCLFPPYTSMFINQIGFLILGLMIRDYAFSTPCGRGNREQDIKTRKNSPSKIGETAHQSCVILTSREKLPEVAVLQGEILPVRSLLVPKVVSSLVRSSDHTIKLCIAIACPPLPIAAISKDYTSLQIKKSVKPT